MVTYPYQAEVSHEGLHKYRIVKAATQYELDQKVRALKDQWDEQWEKKQAREAKIRGEADSIAYAKEITTQAEEVQEAMDRILLDNLGSHQFTINEFKDFSEFEEPSPSRPVFEKLPIEPDKKSSKYNSQPTLFAKLSKKKMAELTESDNLAYKSDYEIWKRECDRVTHNNKVAQDAYNKEVANWEQRKNEFERVRDSENSKIDALYQKVQSGDVPSVEWYVREAIERLALPFSYDKLIEVEYNPETDLVIVDYMLPKLEDIPTLKAVTYVKSRNEFKETHFAESYLKKKYDSVIYQMVLQCINFVFSLELNCPVSAIVINGRVSTIDKSTGKEIEPYVLSVNVSRESFEEVNLSSVDPKAWFKSSKGVSAASLANVTPVAPLITMSREDKRFIDGYNVVDTIDDSVNLAAIDWQDFENLIREIFEKEFSSNGGEVKITQASRDGGVDAVAFDPDPIRGGKIVIQAKRYTNVVGVSAVRDLYGTVMNEGATKGILVTTSNYGNDAYNFAKDKPLTLLNGAELLYLLQKHGYRARIDLKEAKELNKA